MSRHGPLAAALFFVSSLSIGPVSIGLVSIGPVSIGYASDHLDAPALMGKGELDVNDLYAFQSPENADNTVLILTVNPFAGTMSDVDFATNDVEYQFQIDNNGDAMADITYGATFSTNGGGQNVDLTKNGTSIFTGDASNSASLADGGMLQTGLFDDPFFFDLAGFQNGFSFTGVDAFAGANVSAIVLEVPSADLGGPNIGVSARTLMAGSQVDRVGRPAVNTALIPSARKDEFNQASPENDSASFAADVQATIESLNGGDSANAAGTTAILLPDLLTIDTSNAAGFLNGRGLADDVIDAELNLLSKGGVTGDLVNANDVPFRTSFPYLAPQNIVPEPSGALLTLLGLLGFSGLRRRRIE